jgi:DNA-binding response OmpR family regulator
VTARHSSAGAAHTRWCDQEIGEVCRAIVAACVETRVLMLTAAAGIRDRVDGLDLGADDYLTKPFAFAELAARVGALGRRARPALPPVLERAGLRLDLPRTAPHVTGCCCP